MQKQNHFLLIAYPGISGKNELQKLSLFYSIELLSNVKNCIYGKQLHIPVQMTKSYYFPVIAYSPLSVSHIGTKPSDPQDVLYIVVPLLS